MDRPRGRTPQGESLCVWGLWALVLLTLVITYSRLPVEDLYRVDEGGVRGALGRALVLVNFPLALVAIALLPPALDALPRRVWPIGAAAFALCAVVAAPGVVDDHDLDGRAINALPALGVVIAVGLTVAAARRAGPSFARRRRGDPLRIAAATCVLLLSLPWLAAELGGTFPQGIFLTSRLVREPDGTLLPAVHTGHHHGWDGALLVLSVLLLSRVQLGTRGLDLIFAVWLGALGAYGLVNATQDFWLEQVVKRGWVDWRIPGALHPSGSWIWLVVFGLAAVFAAVLLRARHAPARPG